MKKNETKIQNNEAINEHLIEGANFIVNSFKTPSAFLEFLNESLFWIENFNQDRQTNESTFFIKKMIESVIQPWIKNGPNLINDIATGLHGIYREAGHEGYLKEVSILLQGFAIFCRDSPYFDTKTYLLSFETFYGISFYLNSYDEDLSVKREIKKMAEAA